MTHNQHAAEALRQMRVAGPLVHNITNYVSMDVSANVLLAIGAAPAMVHAAEEVEAFARISSSLAINIGTLSAPWVAAMHAARSAARAAGVPVVLDPVGAGATRYRTRTAIDLLEAGVQVVRGNASEILALAGAAAPRGVDAAHEVSEALDAARAIARKFNCVVAATGARDAVTDGERVLFVGGGHPLMTKVNGEVRQDGTTATMIFDIPAIIEHLSQYQTLEPGDLVCTGTPPGVGMGFKPTRFLNAGDSIELSSPVLGTQSMRVVVDPLA